jgi:hypothetical protein
MNERYPVLKFRITKGGRKMTKRVKKCRADDCGITLNSKNRTGFCSTHLDNPAKKLFVGFSGVNTVNFFASPDNPLACLCWWKDDFIKKDYEVCVEIPITGRQYVTFKRLEALLNRRERTIADSSFLSNDIPCMVMTALKKAGKI